MQFHTRQVVDPIKQLENLAGGRLPSQQKVRDATMRYIEQDWEKNGCKYAQEDWSRIERQITEYHHKAPGT